MGQRVPLDRGGRPVYYALAATALMVLACTGRPRSIAPAGLVPVPPDTVRRWVEMFGPRRAVRYDLTWRYTTQQGSSAGRAAVRVAPPDTLRFDYRGPFGRSGSAMIVGGAVLWAQPEDDLTSLVPTAPLFWAALGRPIPPPPGADVYARAWERRRAWRYVTGDVEMDFIERHGSSTQLLAELRHGGRIIGSTTLTFAGDGRRPAEATMRFPPEAAVFRFTVDAVDTLATFGPDTWRR